MRKLLFEVAGVVLLITAVSSAFELFVEERARAVKNSQQGLRYDQLHAREKRDVLVQQEQLSNLPFSGPSLDARFAKLAKRMARDEEELDEQIDLYCKSLSKFGEALTQRPLDAGYLVAWADVKQILGDIECDEPFTKGDLRAALKIALKNDPTNTRAKYAAAKLMLWSGDRGEAQWLLKEFLTYEMEISSKQQDFIFSLLVSPEDFERIVPARFPQIADWSFILRRRNSNLFNRWRDKIAELQSYSLRQARKEYQEQSVPLRVHAHRLWSLLNVVASTPVRQMIDEELALVAKRKGERDLSEYIGKRAKWKNLRTVSGVVEGDTRPLKQPLAGWARLGGVRFDSRHMSIGFYLGENQTVRSIELVGAQRATRYRGEDIQLFVSDDNEKWIDITDSVEVIPFDFEYRRVIVLRPNTEGFRYWKIHFAGVGKDTSFENRLEDMVGVYGAARS